MACTYSQRSLTVLAFLGILSIIMSLLSVILIFQLQSHSAGIKDHAPQSSVFPTEVLAALMPVSTVLSALSLMLNLSSVLVCLLHSYFTTDICRDEENTGRADWFLLDTRAVRHVAVGLFCFGVSVFLAAMSIYMLLVFEMETGITSACVLACGILLLLAAVSHSLVCAANTARRYRGDLPDTMYRNEHDDSTVVHASDANVGGEPKQHRRRPSLQRQLSYPPCADPKPLKHQYSPSGVAQSRGSDKEGYSSGVSIPRMHRTLSAESGLLQTQSKPWNGVNSEMRTVLARKTGGAGKDSTLV
ncbi:transmembrane protein 221 [Paramormyrops kingsleyae]|uniref:Transmembrane protein 221 n=1 Tax=Paramormyrops kingsleyae TaxID=1676925 RepID=A0A3B3QSA1_9TELE|nr:transmembrane protein 221 [Paramormyrops kingsleyae]